MRPKRRIRWTVVVYDEAGDIYSIFKTYDAERAAKRAIYYANNGTSHSIHPEYVSIGRGGSK